MPEFRRKHLPHEVPLWINPTQEAYFITINTKPRGLNQLAHDETWCLLINSIEFREERGEWQWSLVLAMPDHLHGNVFFPHGFTLRKSISDWKRWFAKQSGIKWQDGFFEHRLRTMESAGEKANYIRMNPVRANLCSIPQEWPFIRDWKDDQVARSGPDRT